MQQVDSQWRRNISKVECDEFFTRTRMIYTIYEIGILNVYVTMPAQQCMDYSNPSLPVVLKQILL